MLHRHSLRVKATQFPRRRFLHLAAGAVALPPMSQAVWAQTYPIRPIRWIIGFPAGGGADIQARIMAQWLSERLRQPIIVENRPGAATNIAIQAAMNSPHDGYTLAYVSSANAINATLYEKLPFNFLRDIAPVASLIRQPLVMVVNPSVPAKTVAELIAYAKANPGKITMASYGTGTSSHLAGELFKMMTGVDMIHVPYRGEAPALVDLLGGQVQVFLGASGSIEPIRAGRLRALAVTTAERTEALPDIPTMSDFVPGYEASSWSGVGAPKGTPPEIIERLNREINAGLVVPAIKARLIELATTPTLSTPTAFGAFMAAETEKWGKVVKASGAKPE
jgi:tripartite-type tricarboxylate transporter receptor subunit TctC